MYEDNAPRENDGPEIGAEYYYVTWPSGNGGQHRSEINRELVARQATLKSRKLAHRALLNCASVWRCVNSRLDQPGWTEKATVTRARLENACTGSNGNERFMVHG